jgi:hypothetical protein
MLVETATAPRFASPVSSFSRSDARPDEDLGAPSWHVVERRAGLGRRADGADAIGDGAGEGVDAELPAEGVAAGQEGIAGGELGRGEVAPDGQDAHVAAGGLLGEERAQGGLGPQGESAG